MRAFINWLDELSLQDVAVIGGKTESLDEMHSALDSLGVRVPDGFAITVASHWAPLDQDDLRQRIVEQLSGLNRNDLADLARHGDAIHELIIQTDLPKALWSEIGAAYARLAVESTARTYPETTMRKTL
mgnify:CR=1 FL=1